MFQQGLVIFSKNKKRVSEFYRQVLELEVIESEGDAKSGNSFWGLAYQCQDLAGTIHTLGERGIAVSAMREGRKPGTLVATLKSHHLEIPTLLIQPVR